MKWVTFLFLILLAIFNRDFAKLQFGPIRPLDFLFLLYGLKIITEFNYVRRVVVWKEMVLFAILTIIYVILSFTGLLAGVAEFFEPDYIIRHAYFPIYILVFMAGGFVIFYDANERIIQKAAPWMVLLIIYFILVINWPIISLNVDRYIGFLKLIQIPFLFYYAIFGQSKFSRIIAISYFLIFFGIFGLLNDLLTAISFVGLYLLYFNTKIKHTTPILYAFYILAFSVVLFFAFNSDMLIYTDGNTYWRAIMWGSAIDMSLQNYGFGVGFGTEYYSLDTHYVIGIEKRVFEFMETDEQFLYGPHNSYVSIFLRLGFIGLISYIAIFHRLVRQIDAYVKDRKSQFYCILTIITVNLYTLFNVALESPLYLLGIIINLISVLLIIDRARVAAGVVSIGPRSSDSKVKSTVEHQP